MDICPNDGASTVKVNTQLPVRGWYSISSDNTLYCSNFWYACLWVSTILPLWAWRTISTFILYLSVSLIRIAVNSAIVALSNLLPKASSVVLSVPYTRPTHWAGISANFGLGRMLQKHPPPQPPQWYFSHHTQRGGTHHLRATTHDHNHRLQL